ncbi:MAG: hypothetical protein AAGC68_03510 [Verrucomicrobiota bacterium]
MSQGTEEENEVLAEALERGQIRFFRASKGAARGRSGPEDTGKFAENLMVLQECAILLGEKLGMHAVASAVCFEGDETVGFVFDPNSNPQNPEVAGGMVNRRMSVREFTGSVREFIDS